MMHYPTQDQVESAIVRVRESGRIPTNEAIADAIGEAAGLRPGADVVGLLIKHFAIDIDRLPSPPAAGDA